MPHHHHHSTIHRIEGTLDSFFFGLASLPYPLLLAAIVFLTLLYDSGQAWWLPAFSLILTITFICWALPAWWHGRLLPTATFTPALLLFAIPLAVSLVQLVPNLPALDILSPTVAKLWQEFNDIAAVKGAPTLSLATDATTERAVLFATCGLFLFLLTNTVRSHKQLNGLIFAIACAALGNALMAYISAFSPVLKQTNAVVTGAFLNRNHFAFFMLLGTISALSLLAIISFASSSHHRHQPHPTLKQSYGPQLSLSLLIIIFTLLTAQVISLSRGAFISSTIAILIFAATWLLTTPRLHRHKRQTILAYGVVVILALAFALYFSLAKLSMRYEELTKQEFTMDSRWLVWKDSVKLIADNWQLGVGQGAFPYVIQLYESGNFPENLVGHAHNDFLEFAGETGLPVSILMAVLAIGMMVWTWKKALDCHDKTKRWAALGALIAIIGGLLHELVEFNLQAWANTLTFTAIIAVAACAIPPRQQAKTDKDEEEEHQSRSLQLHRRKRFTIRLPLLIFALVAIMLIPAEMSYLSAGMAYAKLSKDLELGYKTAKPNFVDFQRRSGLIQQASHPLLNQHYLLQQKGVILATLSQTPGTVDKPQLLQKASRYMSQAARRMPTNGETAYLNARLQDLSGIFASTDEHSEKDEKFYDWAIKCQPNVASMLENVGMIAFRDFLEANAQDNPQLIDYQKKRAQNLLQRSLQLRPTDKDIFNALFYLYGNTTELLQVAPQNYDTMSTLAKILITKRQAKNALTLAEHILEQKAFTLERQQLIDTYSLIATTQAIMNLPDKRTTTWQELWNAINLDGEENKQIQLLIDKDNLRKALSELKRNDTLSCENTTHIIQKGTVFSLLGRQTDAIIALLPLTYQNYLTPDTKNIERALAILGSAQVAASPFVAVRETYLRNALKIILAEQTGDHQKLPSYIRELEKLQLQQNEKQRPWLNRHLIHLYVAKAYKMLGETDLAAKAARTSLRLCPKNHLTISLLHQIKPDALTKEEMDIFNLMRKVRQPVAHFDSGLTWYTCEFAQDTITERHQNQTVTYVFSCHHDILQPINLQMIYEDQEGVLFLDPIKFKNGQEMTFRIGEVITVSKTWQPYVKALEYASRLLSHGDIIVKSTGKAMPSPYAWAFKANLKH